LLCIWPEDGIKGEEKENNKSRDAAYYFALEEFVLQNPSISRPTVLFWQTNPCVMLGQYQLADAELDQDRADNLNVKIVRRPSGGGAIYADAGALQISLIQPEDFTDDTYPQQAAREQFADLLVAALRRMGISAEKKGRNDIVLNVEGVDKKIAGMAQFMRGQGICTHASLLFDTNLEALASVLRVDDEKFRTKAVKSIRSRVTNIKETLQKDDSAEQFIQQLKQSFFHEVESRGLGTVQEYSLSTDDLSQVNNIYQIKYGNPAWIEAKTPKFSVSASKRFPAGRLDVFLDVRKGKVAQCSLHGDFLGTAPLGGLESRLIGVAYKRTAFDTVLQNLNLRPYLGDITKEEFLSCVFD